MRRKFHPRRPPRRPTPGGSFLPITLAALLMLILSLCRLFGCQAEAISSRPADTPLHYESAVLLEKLQPLFREDGVELQELDFTEDGRFTLAAEANLLRLQRAGALPRAFEAPTAPTRCTLSGALSGEGGSVRCRELRLSTPDVSLELEGEYARGFEELALALCRQLSEKNGRHFDCCELRGGALLISGVE